MFGAPAKGPAAYASRLTGLADVADVLVNLDRQAPGRLDAWCAGEGPGRLPGFCIGRFVRDAVSLCNCQHAHRYDARWS